MATKSEYWLKTYKTLAQVPALVKAKYLGENIVQSTWSGRNLEQGKSTKFQTSYICNESNNWISLPPIDVSNQLLHTSSPCKKFHAIIREVSGQDKESAQYLEIWTDSALIRSIDLTALDLHHKVYTDDEFGSFEWSPVGEKLLYVAEKKQPKEEPLNKRQKEKKSEDLANVDVEKDIIQCHTFKQDWGETLVDKFTSVVVVYDLEADKFTIPSGVPETICVGKPFWAPDGKSIIGICYYTEPRKLGLVYCNIRNCSFFTLTLDGNYEEISKFKDVTVAFPKLTPNGESMIWMQCPSGGPHINCLQLYKCKLPLTQDIEPELVVDFVPVSKEINNGKLFYGLYDPMIPDRCWSNDGKLLFSTIKKDALTSYILDLESGSLSELQFEEGSQIILDVCNNNILANRRNFFKKDVLLRGKINEENLSVEWEQLSKPNDVESLKDMKFEYMHLSHGSGEEVDGFSAIYIGPKSGEKEQVPLIIAPHGGPHSASFNALTLERCFLLTLGYAIVMVNFRGSTGAGKKSLEYLLGKVGTSDVSDCVLAADQALKSFPWLSPKKVALLGGSHGGFLVTHLAGQYPDRWRAVVARNPVIDIATMSAGSDIPDWCFVEAGYPYSQEGPISEDILLAMRRKSPIIYAHKVKAPVLLQIGVKDLRVPPYQGIDYYHRLKANNIPVSMNVYVDNHSLSQVPNEIGFCLSTAKWLDEHIN